MTSPIAPSRTRSRRRLGLQLGLLAGFGLAFVTVGGRRPAMAGGNDCPQESACTFKKPNVLFVLDYSTAMNQPWDLEQSRWQAAVAAVQELVQPGGFLSQNTHIALIRFGHDPEPDSLGTTIPGDGSGLVDGQALDLAWDTAELDYIDCNGQELIDLLDATPAPLAGADSGIAPWTKGALDFAAVEIAQTLADHPADSLELPPRAYANVLLTAGPWTNADGSTTLAPAEADPALSAAALYDDHAVPTYVFALDSAPMAKQVSDQIAAAGGTTAAIDASSPELLTQALEQFVLAVIDGVMVPQCTDDLPRVMVLLDASSAMLNVAGGTMAGAMGTTGWDQARAAVAGDNSLFDIDIGFGLAEDVTHLGLAVFGDALPAPGEQRLLVQYGPCTKDNFAWALDPHSSCVLPGCEDPWGGPPITWTFADGAQDPPGFDQATFSHMPRCEGADFCAGSGAYLHLGLQLIHDNQIDYHHTGLQPEAQHPTNDSTRYINLLLTRGRYDGYSSDAQVQTALEAMFADGIVTYVIGLGDGSDSPEAAAQLQAMAQWGSGDSLDYYDADSQAELETALQEIYNSLIFDPCCPFNDCSGVNDDEGPLETDSGGSGDTTTDSGDTPTDGGDTTTDGDAGTDTLGTDTLGDSDDSISTSTSDEIGDEIGDDAVDLPDDANGCSCRSAAGEPRAPGLWLGLGLLGLLRLRRRRSARFEPDKASRAGNTRRRASEARKPSRVP